MSVGIFSPKLPNALHVGEKMCVVAIDPANRTRIVCSQIQTPVAILLALVTLVVLVLLQGLLGVNLPLGSRLILRWCRCWSKLRWMICRWRLRRFSNLRGLLVVLWSGLWVCRMGFLWRVISELGL